MRSLLSYYGGKQIQAKFILQCFPRNYHTYAEPFAGGAAVLFAKEPSSREMLNDLDTRVYLMYKVAKEQPELFYDRVRYTLLSKADHAYSVDILKKYKDYPDLEVAWAVVYQGLVSFSSVFGGTFCRSPLYNRRLASYVNKIDTMEQSIQRLKDVALYNIDAVEFIRTFDGKGVLFYVDPPYIKANQGHYSGYSEAAYEKLCYTLDTIQGSYVLSNYAQDIMPTSVQHSFTYKTYAKASFCSTEVNRVKKQPRTEYVHVCDRNP